MGIFKKKKILRFLWVEVFCYNREWYLVIVIEFYVIVMMD